MNPILCAKCRKTPEPLLFGRWCYPCWKRYPFQALMNAWHALRCKKGIPGNVHNAHHRLDSPSHGR